MPIFLRCCLLFAAVVAAGCVRIERHTSSVEVPPAMLGAWTGGWSSTSGGLQGEVTLLLQTFESHPVVRISSAHPCLDDGPYEFTLRGTHMELLRDGAAVFSGDLDLAARRFQGTYECTEDAGVWTADWNHDLPEVGDVSGIWSGTFTAGTAGSAPFTMQVDQVWTAGFLQLHGEVVVDGVGFGFPISSGHVEFQDDRFGMLLRGNQLGTSVVVQGAGTLAQTSTCTGFLIIDGASPVLAGTFSAERQLP